MTRRKHIERSIWRVSVLLCLLLGCGSVTADAPADAGADAAAGTSGAAGAVGGQGGAPAGGASGASSGGAAGIGTAGAGGMAGRPGTAGSGGARDAGGGLDALPPDLGSGWGPTAAPACAPGTIWFVTDCMQRIADPAMPGNPNAGWECAHACLAAVGGQAGPDLAVGGACVAAKVTYCLPPVDGGDPCAGCRP